MTNQVQHTVRLFGAFRNAVAGEPKIVVSAPSRSSVDTVRKLITERLMELNPEVNQLLIGESALANSSRILQGNDILEGSAELALLPPVCGG